MSNGKVFTNTYDPVNKILIGRIELATLDKDQAKAATDMTIEGLNEYREYTDYILDSSEVTETSISAIGYLLKVHGLIKKTAGYMVIVMKEERLQKFMISNPEMFDLFAVFFNVEDAVKFVKSKR